MLSRNASTYRRMKRERERERERERKREKRKGMRASVKQSEVVERQEKISKEKGNGGHDEEETAPPRS